MSKIAKGFGEHIAGRIAQANPNGVRSAVGIGWYRPETYERCLAIFDDASKLPRTYDDWLVRAVEAEKQARDKGLRVVRVEIDPDTFPRWCADEGFTKIDEHARQVFGNIVVRNSLRRKRTRRPR
jgi:hypothetical protein